MKYYVMKYYTSTTEFNCGIDLHSRQMYVCLVNRSGKILVHTNIRNNDFGFFLRLVAPYRHDLTVCAECMFGWYWLADACAQADIHFVLAHALYLKAIHGGKNKNDRIDSEKLAQLLRANLIPPSYSALHKYLHKRQIVSAAYRVSFNAKNDKTNSIFLWIESRVALVNRFICSLDSINNFPILAFK